MLKDLTGQRFGKLIVLKQDLEKNPNINTGFVSVIVEKLKVSKVQT